MNFTLDLVTRVVAHHLGLDPATLSPDTRLVDLEDDELRVIDLMTQIEAQCGCDIPDYQITTLMTLAQLAILVEENSKGTRP